MKIKRLIVALFALLILLLIVAYFVLTSSGFQTSIVNSVLKDAFPGSEAGLVKITPTKLKIEKLSIKNIATDKDLSFDKLEGDISLWSLLFKEVNLKNVSLKNAVLVFNKPAGASPSDSTASKGSAISGLKAAQASPATGAEAQAKSSTASSESSELPKFKVNIRNLNAGFLAVLEDGSTVRASLKVGVLKAEETIKVSALDAELKCDFDIREKAKDSLSLRLTLSPETGHYWLKSALEKAGKSLVKIDAKIDPAYSNIDGKIQILANSSDVKNLARNIPDFDANVLCDLRLASDLSDIGLNGSFKIDASNLKILSEALAPISDIALSGEVSANKRGDEISLANARVLASVNGEQLLHLKNAKAFKFSAKNISEVPDGELLTLDVLNVKDSLINPFLNGLALKSSKISTQILLSKSGVNFELKSTEPLKVSNATLSSQSETFFENLDMSLGLLAKISPQTADADLNLALMPSSGKEGLDATLKLEGFDFAKKSAKLSIAANGQVAPLLPKNLKIESAPKLEALFDLALAGNSLEISTARLDLLGGDGSKIFKLSSANKISIDIAGAKLAAPGAEISASADKFPFAILRPYAQGLDADFLNLKLNLKAASESEMEAQAQVSLENMSFKNESGALVSKLTPSADIAAKLAKGGISLELKDFELKSGSVPLAKAAASANMQLQGENFLAEASANAKISATLPALMNQPCLEKFNNLSGGMAEVEFSYRENLANVNLTLHNIAPRFYDKALAKLELQTQLALNKGALASLNSALRTSGTAGTTDANISAKFSDAIDLVLSAKEICTDEFITLAKAFTKSESQPQVTVLEDENPEAKKALYRPRAARTPAAEPKAKASQSETPDEKAFWDISKSVNLTSDIGKITLESKPLVENLKFKFKMNPSELSLSNLSAALYGANLAADAKLGFIEGEGYILSNTALKLSGLDVASFQTPNESGEVLLEGKFDASANLKAQAPNLGSFANNLQADIELSSSGGTLRLLDKNSVSGMSTSLGGLALKTTGELLGNRVKELSGIGELLGMFEKLDYSKIYISARRGSDLSIEIEDCSVETKDFLIKASGKVGYDETLEFAQNEINLPVNIYAKQGNVAELLKSCGFTEQGGGLKGYAKGPEFKVYGTLANPQNNLKEILLESVKDSLGDVGDSAGNSVKEGVNALGGLLKSLKKL